jgi:hypothetical protein
MLRHVVNGLSSLTLVGVERLVVRRGASAFRLVTVGDPGLRTLDQLVGDREQCRVIVERRQCLDMLLGQLRAVLAGGASVADRLRYA